MKENIAHYRASVCNINYYIVWAIKRRKKILTSEVESYLKEMLYQTAAEKRFTVQFCECGDGDHVHCFVIVPPTLSITQIVKYLKGISGRKLFEQLPKLR